MEFIVFIPASFFVMMLILGLGIFALGVQAVLWIAENILIISLVIWVIIFLATMFLSGPGERLLDISCVCPFIPFYMGAVGIFFQWINQLGDGGILNWISFAMYILVIPLGLIIHIIPSILILVISNALSKECKAGRMLINLLLAAIYTMLVYSNGGALIT